MGHEHEKVVAGLIGSNDLSRIREAVCIQTEKIYDQCREKDCIENARVMFKCPERVQHIINDAINVKVSRAEVVDVFADVEPVPFKRGFYTVDVKYFIKVWLNFFVPRMEHHKGGSRQGGGGPTVGGTRIIPVEGMVVFDKKVILFGSEGNVKIFKATFVEHGLDKPLGSKLQQTNLPISKIEVAEPIALNARIEDRRERYYDDLQVEQLPSNVRAMLDDMEDMVEMDLGDETLVDDVRNHGNTKRVLVSLGLFSIIKLVRFVQLLIPAFDFCVPNKTCIAATEENPCELFETIEFPVDEFFPPQIFDFPGATEAENEMHHHHGHKDND